MALGPMEIRRFFLELDKLFTREQMQQAKRLCSDYIVDKEVLGNIDRMDQLLGELLERNVIGKGNLEVLEIMLKSVQVTDAEDVLKAFLSTLSPGTLQHSQNPLHKDFFVGRENDIKSLLMFFQGQNHDTPPCLFLCGFPGVGKTRLAAHICDCLNSRPEVLFVDLRDITDVGSIARSLVKKIDDKIQVYDMDTLETLIGDLVSRQKEYVIILDNAEEILNPSIDQDTQQEFQNFLEMLGKTEHTKYLKIIITSRFENLLKTTSVKVGTNTSPKIHIEEKKLDRMTVSDSVIFLKRKSGKAQLGDKEAEELAKLCGYCPLAMKLVAGRLQNMEVKPSHMIKVLERSSASLKKKKGPSMKRIDVINNPAYYETAYYEDMKHCIQEAYNKVSHQDKGLLLMLSVIPGTFTMDTAAAVAGLRDSEMPLRLRVLMYYNLVDLEKPALSKNADKSPAPNVVTDRWRLHTLLKMFLEEKNQENSFAVAQENFVRHYAKMVRKIATNLDKDYTKAMRDQENEEANIFHFFALQNQVDHKFIRSLDDPVTSANVVYLMELMLNIPERLNYFQEKVAKAREDKRWLQYAVLRCWEAQQHSNLGENSDVPTAILKDAYHYIKTLPRKEQNSVDGQLALAHFYQIWGNVCVDKGDYPTGIDMLKRSLTIREHFCATDQDRSGTILVKTLNDLGHAFYQASQYSHKHRWSSLQKALFHQTKALEFRERLSNNHCDAVILRMNLGTCYHSMEEYQKAIDTYQAALDLDKDLHLCTMNNRASILKNMALSMMYLDKFKDGFKLAKEAYEIKKKKEDLRQPARCLYLCGLLQMEQREYEKAEEYFNKQLELEEELLRNGRPHSDDWQELQRKLIDLCRLTDKSLSCYTDRFQNAERQYKAATKSGRHLRPLDEKRRKDSDSSSSSTESESQQKRFKVDLEENINPEIFENEYLRPLTKDEVFSGTRDLSQCLADDVPGIGELPRLQVWRPQATDNRSSLPLSGDQRSLLEQAHAAQDEQNTLRGRLRGLWYSTQEYCNIV